MILALKTDTFDSELHLLDANGDVVDSIQWHAGRELSNQLLSKIDQLLSENQLDLQSVTGVIIYQGPGSFTGLRIGFAVANSLGYGLKIPVVSSGSKQWLDEGYLMLTTQSTYTPTQPMYGSEPHITKPKK